MSWIIKYKHVWRVAILVLLLVAIAGPWTFERISVPAIYSCSPPSVRLEGNICGEPITGIRIFSYTAGGFISMVVGLVTGATVLPDRAREFFSVFLFMILLFLLVLPFITTLLLNQGGDSRRLQVFHMVVWGLAAGIGLLFGLSSYPKLHWVLWGIWLYIGLAASTLILKGLTLVAGRRLSQG